MITATIRKEGNYSLLAVIDQFTSLVRCYIISDGTDSQTFYSYTRASMRFQELVGGN